MLLQNKIAKNASWIIGCKIAQAFVAVVIGMLTARYLGPSNYGVISYAASIVAFATPIMQLGLNSIVVQEIVNEPDKDGEILGTSICLSFFSAILCVAGIFVVVSCLNSGERETIIVCCLYSVLLVFQTAEIIQYWFQSKYLSKYTSLISFFAYLVVASYKVVLLVLGMNVYFFAVANAFDGLLLAIAFFVIYRKKGGTRFSVSLSRAKKMFAKSHYYIISGLMIVVFAQTDRLMIKNMMDNSCVGFYSAAVVCASLTSFVFGAVIDSFRPKIFECKKNDYSSYERMLSVLYGVVVYLALLQSIVMTLLAPIIIGVLYGNAYDPSIDNLRIVVWFTAFSYMGGVHAIYFLAEEKQKYLWFMNLCGAVCNIIMNYFFIPRFGINGAALASLITQIFTNVVMILILSPLRSCIMIMLRGLNPAFIGNMLRHFP
ncbi:MAG: flippase [Fibrobacter sp.]|nr:flippase [Fibrobacter sp.]